MKTLSLIQGSQQWHAARFEHFTASEAPVMMGASSKTLRNELLKLKATGSEREYSDWVQRNLFDKGHEYEAMARKLVEDDIGEDLYPVTGTDDEGWLLASFDGMTMLSDTIFEHKMYNPQLAEAVKAGDLPAEYYWQLEQQLLVSRAERAIFVVSDGTRENWASMIYTPVEGRAKQLVAGWKQFEKDLAAFELKPEVAQAVGRTPENLPALRIELTGQVTASNLAEYKEHAFAVIQSINTDLQTDQDFADAEKTIKWCGDVESKLAAAKQHALSQTASIDELFRALDDITAETRAKRLELDRLVKAQKENRRNEIKTAAELAFRKHMDALLKRVSPVRFNVSPDFAGVMKGKRTIATLQDAVDTELARAKIEANTTADQVDANLKVIRAAGHEFLFADLASLALKDHDDLKMVIDARITKHKADEQAKLDAQREKIRAEEQAKLDRERAEAEAEKAKQVEAIKPVASAPRLTPAVAQRPAPVDMTDVPFRYVVTTTAPKAQSRPSDRQIIECLALQFRVHESKVIEWLLDMDLEIASEELEGNL